MWLALETAADRASVAVGRGEQDAVEMTVEGARRHAGAVLSLLDALLARTGQGVRALEGVLVSDGPGSFTGLRVGAAVAKALAHAQRIPVRSAPSLMVRAAGVATDDGRSVLAVSNALRGDLYAGLYRFTAGRVETVRAAAVCRPGELEQTIERPDLVVGDLPDPLREWLERWSGRPLVASPAGAPSAVRLLGLRDRQGGTSSIADVPGWEPDYGRPAEAQAQWEMAHGRSLPHPSGAAR